MKEKWNQSFLLPGLSLLKLLIHLFSYRGYGFFRDEFYYIACSERLAWGYVDQPPFSIFLLRLSRMAFGDSLFAIRLLPALAGAATVYFTGLIVKQLGGGRFAQLLGALAVIIAPIYLAINHYYSMNSFDLLFWSVAAYILILILQSPSSRLQRRYWILLGIVLGLGLLNKISVLWLGLGIVAGIVLTPARKSLLTAWPWIAGLIAGGIFLPHILWQIHNGWPTLEFIHNATSEKMTGASPLAFLGNQVLAVNPFTFPLWFSGLHYYLFAREGKQYRLLGLVYVIVFLVLVVNGKSRVEYLSPAYPMLFAAGGVSFEKFRRKEKWRWLKPVYVSTLIAGGILSAALALPILPVETYIRYSQALGIKPSTEERKELSKLPQHYADMHGWDEMVATVARVYNNLPANEKAGCGIYAQNYGEAGAIDFLGRKYHLPKAISGHNNYWLWGPGSYHGGTMIILGGDAEDHVHSFEQVKQVDIVHCGYCMPYENNNPVYVCRGLKASPEVLWPMAKHYD